MRRGSPTRRWSSGSARLRVARGGDVVSVSEAVLAKIARRDNPQTVIGVFEQRLDAARATSGPAASDV